jgi:hypothetical protein
MRKGRTSRSPFFRFYINGYRSGRLSCKSLNFFLDHGFGQHRNDFPDHTFDDFFGQYQNAFDLIFGEPEIGQLLRKVAVECTIGNRCCRLVGHRVLSGSAWTNGRRR